MKFVASVWTQYNKTIEFGDEFRIPGGRGYGGHSAHVVIDKINRKSVSGSERKGSYHAGRMWRIGAVECALVVTKDDGTMNWIYGRLES